MWPWRKKPKPLPIPDYRPPIEFKHPQPKDPDYVVTEEEMSQTGMFRMFPFKKPKE